MRYFFPFKDGVTSIDEQGIEFADPQQVRAETLRFAGELLCQASADFWRQAPWTLWVTNPSGTTVLTFKVSAQAADVASQN